MLLRFVIWFSILTLSVHAAAVSPADRIYEAIRANDLAALRALTKSAGVDVREKRGATPLMLAAAYGSIDAMKLLIDAGADVNAKNDFDATALLWSTYDQAKVRLLLDKGATVNVVSKQKRTPLLVAAAHHGASETVRLLLDKGASTSVHDGAGMSPLSVAADSGDAANVRMILEKDAHPHPMDLGRAVQSAAGHGDVPMIRMLLAHGANVNAQSPPAIGPGVKNGPISLGLFTPLILAAAYGGVDAVKILVEAGAKVDAQDVRGMTPLMLAIATDRPDVRVVRLLIEKGASLTVQDRDGETVLDWARKYNKAPVLEALGLPPAKSPTHVEASRKGPAVRDAVTASLGLMQKKTDSFFVAGGCAACHAQNLTALAVSVARANGLPIDEKAAREQLESVRLSLLSQEQTLLQRIDPPGASDTLMYGILNMALEKVPADRTTDAVIHNLAGEQRADGSWHRAAIARPPMEDGDFTFTALGIRLFQTYAPPGRKLEFTQRIERAAKWLSASATFNTEDLNFQMLGLKWANADAATRATALRKLRALQRADGGWAQTPELASDAYATGQTLYAFHEVGVPVSDEAYRRGVDFLLRTQKPDGSWYVKSRSAKFQPYFQSGFPHDHDQWISAAGTAWAATGLVYAAAPVRTAAAKQ